MVLFRHFLSVNLETLYLNFWEHSEWSSSPSGLLVNKRKILCKFCFIDTPGAAFSSILTCPLAASLTADSVLNFKTEASDKNGDEEATVEGSQPKRDMPRKYFLGLIFLMVAVSSVVISFNGSSCWVICLLLHHKLFTFIFTRFLIPENVTSSFHFSWPDLRDPDRTGV